MSATGDIESFLATQERKSLLRFITCGSVDDGKSTLIGRLLFDSKLLYDDQLAALASDSKKIGTQGGALDFALLVDGLAAEREQAITIDVAYRYFSTDKRKFIVADTPGHEQYTRNMVTGASSADLAILLVDARKGVLTQTRRHAYIVSMLGIRNIVLAVNKMDLVNWDQSIFEKIVADGRAFSKTIGLCDPVAIPLSALSGDNITEKCAHANWYRGSTLLSHLETVEIENRAADAHAFAMCVQWVNRPNLDFRGFSGTIASGAVQPGDMIAILPSAKRTRVSRIVTAAGDQPMARTGQSITLTFSEEMDCSRGDVIAAAGAPPEISDQFEATLVWMSEEKLLPGRPYILKIGAKAVSAQITQIKHKVDVNTLAELAASTLTLNEIAAVNISLSERIAFTPYTENPELGGFILIDRVSNETAAAGLIRYALRRAQNIHWQAMSVTRDARASLMGQRAAVLWFTGLSGAGKSTIADLVAKKLHAEGRHTYVLDGDNVRHGLNRDLGFTDADRVENIRRVAEVAKLMADAGLIVLVSFISPFRAERAMARSFMAHGEFLEIFIDTPLALAEQRDVKGLYKKARTGELKTFTGVDSPYEPPEAPELRIDAANVAPEEAAEIIVAMLTDRKVVNA